MPVSESVSNWNKILSNISTSGSGWVTTTTPSDTWSVATTTTDSSYIWTTSTTPITASGSTLTITSSGSYEIVRAPDLATREHEFPLFDTYNLDSPKGREKFVEAFKEYLLTSFQPLVTLPVYA